MRKTGLLILLLLAALVLAGCRFAVIETGSVRIAPTAQAGAGQYFPEN